MRPVNDHLSYIKTSRLLKDFNLAPRTHLLSTYDRSTFLLTESQTHSRSRRISPIHPGISLSPPGNGEWIAERRIDRENNGGVSTDDLDHLVE